MTDGSMMYLSGVIAAFVTFGVVLAWAQMKAGER